VSVDGISTGINWGNVQVIGTLDAGKLVNCGERGNDALPHDILRQLFADALAQFWDDQASQDALAQEARDKSQRDGAV
jgi:hypothetical protein